MLNLQEIGKRIRESRERLELSVYYIGQLERGERMMSLEAMANLASCLHVSIDYLVWGQTEDEKKKVSDVLNAEEEGGVYACSQDEEIYELLQLCSVREKELIAKLIKVILPYMK